MIGALIAYDQPLVRMGLRALVTAEPGMQVVAEADTGREAVERTLAERPDVVLMDIRMPELDGLAALRRIVADERCADTHVVILTTFELDEYLFAALEGGAAGFLVKDSDPDEIVRAIRAATAGESLLSASVTRTALARSAAGPPPEPADPAALAELTDREGEVLALVAEGLNNEEIAARLWISKATARTHVSHIMVKLGARDRAQLVVKAFRAGLAR